MYIYILFYKTTFVYIYIYVMAFFWARVFPCQWNNRVNLSAFPKSPVSSDWYRGIERKQWFLVVVAEGETSCFDQIIGACSSWFQSGTSEISDRNKGKG